jgi:hypothetical protein
VAVVFPAALSIVKAEAFMAPAMSGPLAAALLNANAIYRAHRPALVSFCPMMAPGHARDVSFTAGCVPSADSIRYRVVHVLLPAFNGNVTVQVESGLGDGPTVWTGLYGPAAQACVANTWLVLAHNVLIAAGEDRLRFSYTAPGGAFLMSHVLVYPDVDPAALPTGQQPSGFWPADDALLSAVAGGPVHTEMLDRCWRNAIAVLRDRWQCAGSFVQDDGQYGAARHVAPLPTVATGAWSLVGKARLCLPFQSSAPVGGVDMRPALRVAVLADVSAGATNARVRVVARGADGKSSEVQLGATGAMVVSSDLRAEVDGSADAGVDLEWHVRADAGQTVSLRSAMVHWRPGD